MSKISDKCVNDRDSQTLCFICLDYCDILDVNKLCDCKFMHHHIECGYDFFNKKKTDICNLCNVPYKKLDYCVIDKIEFTLLTNLNDVKHKPVEPVEHIPLAKRLLGKAGRIKGTLYGMYNHDDHLSQYYNHLSHYYNHLNKDGQHEEYTIISVEHAKRITYQETVTPSNIEKLEKIVKNGPYVYPGANAIITRNGEFINLHWNHVVIELKYGDIVERHIMDNDVLYFNGYTALYKIPP